MTTESRRVRRAWRRALAPQPWTPKPAPRAGGFVHISEPLARVMARIEAAQREGRT